MTDLLVGATAGLSSSASIENTAGQASSGTQTIIPPCHMPTKSTELLGNGSDTGESRFVMPYRRKAVLMRLPALLCQEG